VRTAARNTGLLVCLFGAIGWNASGQARDKYELPDGDGKVLMERICMGCHGLGTTLYENHAEARWKFIVDVMVSRGAVGTDAELATVVKYLAKNFGKS
jgi:mono/diheme cytochrome c family protein